MDIAAMRRAYAQGTLDPADVDADPLRQLERWLAEAARAGAGIEANAMTVATVGADGTPSARVVLLKGISEGGLVFFTNAGSRKARELAARPRAAACFHWPLLERQVRASGGCVPVSREEAEAYFATRPADSRRSAWASPQSDPIESRRALEERFAQAARDFPDDASIPMPESWGGFRLVPEEVEFWQGRAHRLHDRVRYLREGEGWRIERLAP